MQILIRLRLASVLLATCELAACHAKPPLESTPAVVVVAPVQTLAADAAESIRYPVEVAARFSSPLSFRVAGKLVERDVHLGDLVRKGQVLARLDAGDAQKQAASAQAAFDAAAHRLTFATQQLERDKASFAQYLIAQAQLEQTQDAYSAALYGRDEAASQLAVARNAFAYTTLLADHDGFITSEDASTGQVLSAGQAVFGLAWSGETDVILDAAAADLAKISVGQPADVALSDLPGQHFAARVREVSRAADPLSRTYRVKLTLHDSAAGIHLGMTGDATLMASGALDAGQRVFTVAATALFHQGQNPAVWVVKPRDSTLELRPVSVRRYKESSVVIDGGLAAGERVVMAGVHTVHAGEHVTAVKPLFADDDSREPAR